MYILITGQSPRTLSCMGYHCFKYLFSSLSLYYSRHAPRNSYTSGSPGDAPQRRMLASASTPCLHLRCQTEVIRQLAEARGGTFTHITERGWVLLWRYVPPQFWIPLFIPVSFYLYAIFSLQVGLMKPRVFIVG